jgi:halogenation protein CepH
VRGVCGLTGAADALDEAGFTMKRGGTFRWGSNPEPWTFSFSISPKMTGKASHAYQVERSKFDKILLDHAETLGADVRQQCDVTGVLEDGDRIAGVTYVDDAGNARRIRARYVIDASGNRSNLYKHVGGTRKYSDFFRSLALFGYFKGGKRLPTPNSGNILCAAFESGWFWYIPLSDTLTSVGAVVRQEMAAKIQGDPEQALADLVAECPLIAEYLDGAERVTEGQYGTTRVRKDYSYHNTLFWKPGMTLIGDAACFVDPIFSSGVHLATYSALLAARSINSVLAGLMDEKTAFDEFEARYRREYGVFYEFLMSFYNMHVDEDSYFWSAKKITQNTESGLESFVELVGGVSSGEGALVETDLRSLADRAEEVADVVDEFVADDQRSMMPWFRSSIVREASHEMTQIQSLAVLGADKDAERPLFQGGLVTSPDGMFWAVPGQEQ